MIALRIPKRLRHSRLLRSCTNSGAGAPPKTTSVAPWRLLIHAPPTTRKSRAGFSVRRSSRKCKPLWDKSLRRPSLNAGLGSVNDFCYAYGDPPVRSRRSLASLITPLSRRQLESLGNSHHEPSPANFLPCSNHERQCLPWPPFATVFHELPFSPQIPIARRSTSVFFLKLEIAGAGRTQATRPDGPFTARYQQSSARPSQDT